MATPSWPPSSPPGQPPPSPKTIALSDQQYLVSDNQVLVSVYVNALWGGLCIFGFVVLRGWVRGPGGVFQRRQELQDLFMRPPRLVLGTIRQVWNWLLPLLAVSDAEIVSCSGFDALILTRVLLIGLQMFTVMTLFGMVVLIPVYYTRGGVEESSASLGTMARLSVANIPTGSLVFLLPFFMSYVFIGYGCWVLLINCKCYAQLRMAYFCCLDALPSSLQPEGELGLGPAASATAAAVGNPGAAVGATSSTSSTSIPHDERPRVENSRNSGSVVLELPQLRGGGHDRAASAAAIQPVAEGVEAAGAEDRKEWGPEKQVAESDAFAGTAVACTAGGGSTACAEATEESDGGGGGGGLTAMTPEMALRSTWLNMANFFNPTLRMMLDYLDWQNPLQRTAALFGVRDLQLPTVTVDEVPRRVRLYNNVKDPLLTYDDLVGTTLTSSGGDADPSPLGLCTENPSKDCVGDQGNAVADNESIATADAARSAAVVLPYWRPVESLQLIRGAGLLSAGDEVGETQTSNTRLRRVAASMSQTHGDSVAVSGIGGGGGAAAVATSALLPASSSTTSFLTSLNYSLRHSTNVRRGPYRKDEASPAMAAATPATPATSAMRPATAARLYGMTDPQQPLLPGKRNVRLLQLLQTPMPIPPDDGGGGGGHRAHLRCTVMKPTAGGGGGTANEDPIRLVNASHYVVLIKRVHLKLRPGIVDRMAALTYIAVNRLRQAATWATENTAGIVKSYHGGKRCLGIATAGAAVGPSGAGGGATSGLSGRSTATAPGQCLTVCDVEAQAVGMAAAAAQLHGLPKIQYDVKRYFEMFDDPGTRQFDPLKNVCTANMRAKSKSMRRQASAVSNIGGSNTASNKSSSGGGAAVAVNATAATVIAATTSAFTAVDSDAVVAAAKANADAEQDPNGAAVAAVLHDLFPKTFQGLIPVSNHDAVDKLIYRWDAKMIAIATAVRHLERLEALRRRRLNKQTPRNEVVSLTAMEEGKESQGAEVAAAAKAGTGKGGGCGSCGSMHKSVAAVSAEIAKVTEVVSKLRTKIRDLEAQIELERAGALKKPVGTAYFAIFSSSQDAQMLGQCRRVVPPQGPGTLLSFDAVPAPSPEDVSWPALWSTGSLERAWRRAAIILPMAIIFAIPIGPLQGALAALDVSLCGGTTTFEGITTNKLYVGWFCEPKNLGVSLWKSLITGVLPSVLGLLWTALVMPHFLYFCSSIARNEVSLSGQERQMQTWFFWYSLINTFLGAVLGSGVFSQLGTYLADPKMLLDKIGRALPTTANFFIQFCIARALFTNFVRLLWPHTSSMFMAILRALLRVGLPRSLHAAALAHMPPSTRAISYYNAILQVFMFGCAFAVVAPIILPCCWLFFLTGFFSYRYAILYVYERSYESGGRMWPMLFGQMMGFLILMEVFTGAVLVVNKAWVLAVVIWVTLTPPLLIFWRYCSVNYLEPVHFPPLSVVASEPRHVHLSPLVYMPPALRPGALGWYPEQGKVWEKYGIPKHW
ncbi:hypothetical protein Vafri_17901 [Volvox africanus]|uniref:ERD4-related membrane protein n=1 Tax=Volvox africanus TaxID=51714 RepID=A0A8J4BLA9_9CHLO|nr:hypothetical protein Vafri_17901 [Volvox africanus]